MTSTAYKLGVQVPSPDPHGDAAQMLVSNDKALADIAEQHAAIIDSHGDQLETKASLAALQSLSESVSEKVNVGDFENALTEKLDATIFSTFAGQTNDALDSKANQSDLYQLGAALGSASGYDVGVGAGQIPVLDSGGKLNQSVVPAIAITDTYVVSNQTAMLALTAQVGDVCVRTDLIKSFILKGANPSVLADWQELLNPLSPVQSVNGLTGTVVVTKASIGLGNVPNIDPSNAGNITSGTINAARLPTLSYLSLTGGSMSGSLSLGGYTLFLNGAGDSNHVLYYDGSYDGAVLRGYSTVRLETASSGYGITIDDAGGVSFDASVYTPYLQTSHSDLYGTINLNGTINTPSTAQTKSVLMQTSDVFGDYTSTPGFGPTFSTPSLTNTNITFPAGVVAVVRGKRIVTAGQTIALAGTQSYRIDIDPSGMFSATGVGFGNGGAYGDTAGKRFVGVAFKIGESGSTAWSWYWAYGLAKPIGISATRIYDQTDARRFFEVNDLSGNVTIGTYGGVSFVFQNVLRHFLDSDKLTLNGAVVLKHQASTPATPASGSTALFFDNVGTLKTINSSGTIKTVTVV